MLRNRRFLFALALSTLPLGAPAAFAQQPDPAALGPRLQDATIVGQGGTLTITRLPVKTPGGIVYRDITIQLKMDESGALEASTASAPDGTGSRAAASAAQAPAQVIAHDVTIGQVTETAAAPEVEAPFVAGFYRDVDGGGMVHVIRTGRAIVTRGFGVTTADFPTWTLSAVGGDTAITAAHWYAGPIHSNPNRHLVNLAGVTDETYSYGSADADGAANFDEGMLIGAKQTGNELTIVSFHKSGCCTYSDTPTSEVTYTLIRGR